MQKKLHQASDTIEKTKVRSNAIGRKLRDVQELPVGDAKASLPNPQVDDDIDQNGEDEVEDSVMVVTLSSDIHLVARK